MKNPTFVSVLLVPALLLFAEASSAETFVYTPDPADLYDLDHTKWYTWGIDASDLIGWTITEVELRIEDINNWDHHANVLFIRLLDDADLGVRFGNEGENFADYFAGQGALIAEWHDTNGTRQTDDLRYFLSTLDLLGTTETYCADGVLALAFDPDCHFWNNGVSLVITADMPSPAQKTTWGQLKNKYR